MVSLIFTLFFELVQLIAFIRTLSRSKPRINPFGRLGKRGVAGAVAVKRCG